MYAMLPLYEPNSPQYKELERRLIMTRVAQGNSIDKAKGVQTKPFPKHWCNYQRQSEEDTDEIKQKKEFFNSILVEKKPYFFKYLYKDSRVAYNKFLREEESYRQIYGIDLSSIQSKDESELTEKEKYYLASMNYRNPLIESDCEMNRICRYLESVDFDIKHPKEHHDDIYKLYMCDGIEKNINTYNSVKRLVKSFFQSLREDVSMSDYSTSLKYVPDEEHKIINKYGSLKRVFEMPAEELINNRDLTENAAVLLSLIKQVAKDYILDDKETRLKIRSKNDAANIVEPILAHRSNEMFCIICMDINQNVINIECFEEGEPDYTDIDVDRIIAKVVEHKAAFAIIAHNHPNGTYSPSSNDIATTNVIKRALSLTNVTLMDHLIVCGDRSYSLAQNRMCNLRY